MSRKPSPQLIEQVKSLLDEVSEALSQPDDYLTVIDAPALPSQMNRLNMIATRLCKYVERQVLEYIVTCSYVDRTTWLRKPRVIIEIIDSNIRLTVYGLKRTVLYAVEFTPTEYAHTKPYFKNTICQ